MAKLKKYKIPSFKESFTYGPSRLAKRTTAVAIDRDDESAWESFIKRFLEAPLCVPCMKPINEKDIKKFLLTRQNHDHINYYVILFENEERLQDWLAYKSGISEELKSGVIGEHYATGMDFLLSIKPSFFLGHKLMLDVGRRNKYIVDINILNWMRKKAQSEKRRRMKNKSLKD